MNCAKEPEDNTVGWGAFRGAECGLPVEVDS
jgi:hypothetical protein